MNVPLFYTNKPIFGMDIGHSTLKVVQLGQEPNSTITVQGYGFNTFAGAAIENGIITDPSEVAQAAYSLLTEKVVGGITTNRVVAAIPVSKTFTRILTLPAESEDQLEEAVRLEVEQYVPVPIDDLYIDFEITHRDNNKKEEELEILMVAAPKLIVDSYMDLYEMLGLEVAAMETSLISSVRGVRNSFTPSKKAKENQPKKKSIKKKDKKNQATLLIDFGAKSSDLSIFDNTIRVTGTIQKGGDSITKAIADKMKLTERQAHTLKSRHGLNEGKHQKKIAEAAKPVLTELGREIRKMKRYYEGRASDEGEISKLIILGGGANLPGLPDFLKKETGIETGVCNTWNNVNFGRLQEPHRLETTMYTTAFGLALTQIQGELV